MNRKFSDRWTAFQSLYQEYPECRLSLDLSRLKLAPDFLSRMVKPMQGALEAMRWLEAGEEVNTDEKRMVGHYWLRDANRAPNAELKEAIQTALSQVREFARQVHSGEVKGEQGPFRHLLVVGIGGSALGPQFVSHALGHPREDRMSVRFLDNTDPDGMDRVLAALTDSLGQTLVVVISKSGTTPETRNGMLEVAEAYRRARVPFERHAVAITQFDEERSALYRKARAEKWLAMFPMWDWVGGRTSVTSAVGLLPAALQGLDIDGFLEGARVCDERTRNPDVLTNPAALLALSWYHTGEGRGTRDMVVLPYKDRLELFSKYLQQLVMESLGKELDQSGRIVNQGIAVYGNKGSTDQHAYVQQLREGLNNFFVVFIQVLRDRNGTSLEVEPGVTSGDYLHGLYLGTRKALFDKGRESISLTVTDVSPFSVGVLIALFERAVGLYAALIRINAYHQPGVEAGKKAAAEVLQLQSRVVELLRRQPGQAFNAEELASAADSDDPESIFKICQHLAANGRGIIQSGQGLQSRFQAESRP